MKRWPLKETDFWITAPFFRLLLPLVAGIGSYYLELPLVGTRYFDFILLSVALLFFILLVGFSPKSRGRGNSVIYLAALHLLLFTAGFAVSYYCDIRNEPGWFGNDLNSRETCLAVVTEQPTDKGQSWKIPVKIIKSVKDGKICDAYGKGLVYCYKGGPPLFLQIGDTVLLPGKWQPIVNAGNPYEFDYVGYCRRNNLYFREFCTANQIRLYGTFDATTATFLDRAHTWCSAQLEAYIHDPKTSALMEAMLLGDEANLDEDLRKSWSAAGIIHIIAISGGNVGIFFLVISWCFRWVKDTRYQWLKWALALPLVWLYVIMAGMSASAIRAAVMFSFFAVSILAQRNNNGLNQLCATAFILLLFQPAWLFAIGFQLSFVAVLSLILFYEPIHGWYLPKKWITRQVWGALSASLAAEILVAPLVIYYFHSFPLLFLVANVLAYFFMGLVLVAGAVILVTASFPIVANYVGMLLAGLVRIFNDIINPMQHFSPASFRYLAIDQVELVATYAVIAGASIFFMRRKKGALFTALISACILTDALCRDEWRLLHQSRFVVYNTPKTVRAEIINGKYFSKVTSDTGDAKKEEYAVNAAHINWGAWRERNIARQELYAVGKKKVLVLDRPVNDSARFPVDYLVINYKTKLDLAKLKEVFSPECVILGNTYTARKQTRYKREGASLGIRVHAVAADGAFEVHSP